MFNTFTLSLVLDLVRLLPHPNCLLDDLLVILGCLLVGLNAPRLDLFLLPTLPLPKLAAEHASQGVPYHGELLFDLTMLETCHGQALHRKNNNRTIKPNVNPFSSSSCKKCLDSS